MASGPEGMRIDAAGVVTWHPPVDFVDAEVTVIITLSNGAEQTRHETFTIRSRHTVSR